MKLLEQQILFEIAMAVGNGSNLNVMLQNSLSVMMRKLGCNIGAVVRGTDGAMEVVHSIPYHIKTSPEVLSICQRSVTGSAAFSQPLLGETAGHTLIAFTLQGYGVLVLGKAGALLSKQVLGTLTQIAGKLSTACLACEQAQTIKEAQVRTQLLLDSVVEGIYGTDTEGRCTFVNQAALRILGYRDANELVGKHLRSLIQHSNADGTPPPNADCHLYQSPQVQESQRTNDEVFWRRDGSAFPVEYWSHPIIRDGQVAGAVTTFFDVTERKQAERALRHFRTAMDASADAIYLVDRASMRFIDVNEAACRMQSRTHEELLALGPDGVLSKSRDELMRTYDSIIAGGPGTEPLEMLRQREDGTQVWVELRRRAQRSGDGWMIVTTVRDITERKKAEQALRDSMEKLRLFADNVPALIASWDENLYCRFANKAFVEFFGLAGKDVIGKHVREFVGEDAYREIEGYFAQALRGHKATYKRARKLPDAEPRYIEVTLLPHIGDEGKVVGCFTVTTDITEHKLAEEHIQQVAHHDNLTGLANRLLFNDRLNQAINLAKRNSRQVALLYLDLDKFKPVNDTLGHSAGDELLKGVAARLQRQVRESDTVARIGGDEFTVILPDIARREEAEAVAKKIAAALGTPFQLGSPKQSFQIGTSIGIALYPADAQDVEALIKAADAAMYCAKQAG